MFKHTKQNIFPSTIHEVTVELKLLIEFGTCLKHDLRVQVSVKKVFSPGISVSQINKLYF